MACTCAASRAAASRSAGASSSRPSRPARRAAPRAEAPATQTQATAISFEEQRRIAKAMTQYYEDLKIEAEVEGKVGLGWTEDNEILNGRWAMMGFLIGGITEYATGFSFTDQVAITLSNLGILETGF